MFFTLYSGAKRKGFFGAVPSLFDQCIQVLKENVEFIEEVGGLPYEILEPVLSMANEETLLRIEDCNPHLMEDTGKVNSLIFSYLFNKICSNYHITPRIQLNCFFQIVV